MWRSTAKAVSESKQTGISAQRSAQAAEDSVAVANQSLAIAQSTARRQLRAYVSVEGFGVTFSNLPLDEKPLRVIFSIKFRIANGGQTPAYNMRYGAIIKFSEWSDREVLSFKEPVRFDRFGVSMPGVMGTALFTQTLDIDSPSIMADAKRIQVRVMVEYTDAFEEIHIFEGNWTVANLSAGLSHFRSTRQLDNSLVLEMIKGTVMAS